MDKRLRSAETISDLMSLVSASLTSFDVGNLVIALSAGARIADERVVPTLRFGYPAWNQLLAKVLECSHCLEPRGLAMVAHSAAKLGWRDAALKLSSCASAKSKELNTTDLAKICWAMSKLGCELPDFWGAMEDAVIDKIASAKSVDLSMIAWAFGHAEKGGRAINDVARAAIGLLDELTPQCLANTAWAAARLEAPNTELCRAIVRKSLSTVGEFADFDVTHLCWALAKLDAVDTELFDRLADHTVSSGFIRRFSSQMASQLAWAFAVGRVRHPALFDELAAYVAKHAHVLEPRYLASCAWAFASVSLCHPSLVQALMSVSKGGKLWSFQPSEFCALSWAFAKLGVKDEEVLSDLLQVALKRLPELDRLGVVNLLASLVASCTRVSAGKDWTLKQRLQQSDPHNHLTQILDAMLHYFLAHRQEMNPAQLASICQSFCRADRLQDAYSLVQGTREVRILAILTAAAERCHDALSAQLWGQLADAAPNLPLRAACLFCASDMAQQLHSLGLPYSKLIEPGLGQSTPMEDLQDLEEFEESELAGLLVAVLSSEDFGNPAEILKEVETFGSRCRFIEASLGSRATVLDELTARLPHLLVDIRSGCGSSAARLAARVQEYGGQVVSMEESPFRVAVARCLAEVAGIAGSWQCVLGDAEDALPELLATSGCSSIDVLLLHGGSEEHYLNELRRVEELGLFTSGCVLADHMLYGSPRFLQEMSSSRKYRLELVEVASATGEDWMALCAVQAILEDCEPESVAPLGLASLTAEAEEAWKSGPTSSFKEKMRSFVQGLGLMPSPRFAETTPLPSKAKAPRQNGELSVSLADKKQPVPVHEPSTEAKSAVAQEYLRALDLKRWLSSVDPSGGCLDYAAAVQKSGSLDQILQAYLERSAGDVCRIKQDFFHDHNIRAEHRFRFERWFKETYDAEPDQDSSEATADLQITNGGFQKPSAEGLLEEEPMDLKQLSFAEWLVSMDPSEGLHQYLACIEESYDTVSQIAATYTAKNGHDKLLDPQLFVDFGIVNPDHQNKFHNWFIQHCGVREKADSLGPEQCPGQSSEALHPALSSETRQNGSEPNTSRTGTLEADSKDTDTACEATNIVCRGEADAFQEGTAEQESHAAESRASGTFFDFDDLPPVLGLQDVQRHEPEDELKRTHEENMLSKEPDEAVDEPQEMPTKDPIEVPMEEPNEIPSKVPNQEHREVQEPKAMHSEELNEETQDKSNEELPEKPSEEHQEEPKQRTEVHSEVPNEELEQESKKATEPKAQADPSNEPDDLVPTDPNEEVAQLRQGSGASGGMFDFDELEEVVDGDAGAGFTASDVGGEQQGPSGTEVAAKTCEQNGCETVLDMDHELGEADQDGQAAEEHGKYAGGGSEDLHADKHEDAVGTAPSGGFFDFDDLEEAEHG
ncbi:unnamed protein product [Effrenium voratum]|nr:unnamed protein product [Effrenium voratum]